MVRTIDIRVPDAWQTPPFFSASSPEEIALALDTASSLLPYVSKVAHAHHDQQEAARRQGVEETVEAALRHLRDGAVQQAVQERHEIQAEALQLRSQLDESRIQLAQLHQTVEAAQRQLADAEAKGRAAALLDCDARLRSELKYAEDRRGTMERDLRSRADEAVGERDTLRQQCAALAQKEKELVEENQRLRTPSGRGESGEADVLATLTGVGYRVVDTSKWKEKERYGDLLCYMRGEEDDSDSDGGGASASRRNVRLAVEVKNRAKLSRAEVVKFEKIVQSGVADGLFEGGMLVSLRCAIPQKSTCASQALLEDDAGKPTIPMAYLAAERGNPPRPVSAEHVEIVTQAHLHLCQEVVAVRSALGGGDVGEQDMRRMQAHIADLSAFVTEIFAEFGKHTAILDSARRSLDAMKQSCLVLYRTARRMNSSTPWLQRPMAQLSCERGIDHAVRLAAEGRLQWTNVSHKDTVLSVLGKECAQNVVNEELRLLAKEAHDAETGRNKRPRGDAGEGE